MNDFGLVCPVPIGGFSRVQLAHGGGGRIAHRLVDEVFLAKFSNPALDRRNDASILQLGERRIAVTTDAFVVTPWQFPGGNIGSLAVHGSLNDLAMVGARPMGLTAAFILEEGLPISDLQIAVDAMQSAAAEAGVAIVAGDTKVVERGKADGLFIVTTGLGEVVSKFDISPKEVRDGDAILISGDIGRHGAAIMSVRESLALDKPVLSDSNSVVEPVLALLSAGITIHCLRDATRGGLATILNEIARDGQVGMTIEELQVPIRDDVAGICEVLGLDPLYMACEGRFAAFVPQAEAQAALAILQEFEVTRQAAMIGRVNQRAGEVSMRSRIGVLRALDSLTGDQLPRIC